MLIQEKGRLTTTESPGEHMHSFEENRKPAPPDEEAVSAYKAAVFAAAEGTGPAKPDLNLSYAAGHLAADFKKDVARYQRRREARRAGRRGSEARDGRDGSSEAGRRGGPARRSAADRLPDRQRPGGRDSIALDAPADSPRRWP